MGPEKIKIKQSDQKQQEPNNHLVEKLPQPIYINRKLEDANDRVVTFEEKQEKIDFFKEYVFKSEDKIDVKIGNTEFSLQYNRPSISEYSSFLFSDKYIGVRHKIGLIRMFADVRKLKKFSLKSDMKEYDIMEILPKDYDILFSPNNIKSSFINAPDKIVFLGGSPLTKEGLLALSHEIGHFEDFKRKNILQQPGGLDILLRSERDAWAFGLNNLKPFLKDLKINEKEVNTTVHDKCLQSYSDYIRTFYKTDEN